MTVINDGGDKFAIDGAVPQSFKMIKGVTYKFDMSMSQIQTNSFVLIYL